jgi:hypothetical protein
MCLSIQGTWTRIEEGRSVEEERNPTLRVTKTIGG